MDVIIRTSFGILLILIKRIWYLLHGWRFAGVNFYFFHAAFGNHELVFCWQGKSAIIFRLSLWSSLWSSLSRPQFKALMSRILGIDHILLAITPGGEAAARQFYGDVLGLTEIPKPQALAGRGGLWFECGPLQIHLGIEPHFQASKAAHPALLVEDLSYFSDRLQASQCTIDRDRQLPGYQRLFTVDPFGNRIELMQKTVKTEG